MEILIEEKYKGKITSSLVKDLFREVVYVNPENLLGSRGAVVRKSISGLNIVIRMYRRGGMARFVFSNVFLKTPFTKLKETRPYREFHVLKLLTDLPVPSPVAAAVRFHKFTYSGIIITKEIPLSHSLLQHSTHNHEFTKKCVQKAGLIARAIVEKGVYHPDLHLGNVLYQGSGDVFIIDFDRASILKTNEQKKNALKKISKRWSRSVRKWKGHEAAMLAVYEKPFISALFK